MSRSLLPLLVLCLGGLVTHAAEIRGTIKIERKLTRSKVTATVSSYSRGAAVDLDVDKNDDPLTFERSHVVIYVEGLLPSGAVTAAIEQKNRRFTPDLLGIPAGSTVTFPNRDVIFHNVFSLSKTKAFDLGNYPKDHTRNITFSNPGIVYVNCHLHPNMTATIIVAPNRWVTKADASGRFLLQDLPAGSYTVVAWHKAVGFFRQPIKLDADSQRDVQIFIPFAADESLSAAAR